jgi:uncharacterized caspase-like protein
MIIYQWLKTFGFLVPWLMTAVMAASAQTNVALVIGNSAYQSTKPLTTTIADATAVADTMRGAGYDVTLLNNVRLSNLGQIMRDFLDKVAARDGKAVAFFYYAGYAARSGSDNYLVPVDADIKGAGDVLTQALRLGDLIDALAQTPAAARIVALDSSYDHGFGRSMAQPVPPGLAPMEAPSGMTIASAAAPGEVAAEGSGIYSLYTRTLVNLMRQRGLELDKVFKGARYQVSQATAGKQTPWMSTALMVDVTLFPISATAPAAAPPQAAAPPAKAEPAKKKEQRRQVERRRRERAAGGPAPVATGAQTPQLPPATIGIGGGGISIGIGR